MVLGRLVGVEGAALGRADHPDGDPRAVCLGRGLPQHDPGRVHRAVAVEVLDVAAAGRVEEAGRLLVIALEHCAQVRLHGALWCRLVEGGRWPGGGEYGGHDGEGDDPPHHDGEGAVGPAAHGTSVGRGQGGGQRRQS